MADYLPSTYTMKAAVSGDTFPGFQVTGITVNGGNPTDSLSSSRIHFRTTKNDTGTPDLELTSSAGDISIDDADTWAQTVGSFNISLSSGRYFWDLENTDSAARVRTYLKGTWEIEQDTTHGS